MTTAAMPKSTMLTTKEERFRIVDLGEHLLREGGEPLGLKELQLLDVARTFPPLKTFKVTRPAHCTCCFRAPPATTCVLTEMSTAAGDGSRIPCLPRSQPALRLCILPGRLFSWDQGFLQPCLCSSSK